MISLIFRVLRVADGYQGRIRGAAVLSFLKSFCAKAPFVVAFFMISAFLDGTVTKTTCVFSGIALVACIIVQSLLQNAADRLQSAAGFEIFADKRKQLGSHLRKLPMGYFTEGNIGKISSVLATDMLFIEENLMMVLGDLMSYLFSAVIFVIMMFGFNPWMGLLSLVITLIMYAIGEAMKSSQLKYSDERQAASQKLTESVLDFTEGIGIIKTYNLLGEKSKTLTDSFVYSCERNLEFEEGHAPWARAVNLTYGLGSTAMLALSWFLYQNGAMNIATFIGFLFFTFELFGPLKAFYGQITRLTVMNACLDRIEAVFEEKELCDNGKDILPDSTDVPEIEFRNVTFAYDKRNVLNHVSFTVQKNTMTALVGPSGGGKSTIASLLPRFWDVKDGSILLRGKDIRTVPLASLMENISMVFQNVYLFEDTILNNIRFGKPDATMEEVREAARKARCHDFIMALPEGYETPVGEGGVSLSGGERQRISLARAMLKDAPVIILDEATASVDPENERQLQEAFEALTRDKTVIMIAHRLSTVRKADQILVLDKGRIIQRGRHEELMEQGGLYADFIRIREQAVGWSL